jgi:hypothetical protein
LVPLLRLLLRLLLPSALPETGFICVHLRSSVVPLTS